MKEKVNNIKEAVETKEKKESKNQSKEIEF
jgi:hypothetical protein